jgi:hypothetical protein
MSTRKEGYTANDAGKRQTVRLMDVGKSEWELERLRRISSPHTLKASGEIFCAGVKTSQAMATLLTNVYSHCLEFS